MTDVRDILEECQEVAARVCSQWECSFLDSLEKQLEDDSYELSPGQNDKLLEIYGKVCESPY